MLDITAISALVTAVKTLADIASNANNAEATRQVVEVQTKIIAVQQLVLGLQEENTQLKGEIRNLRDGMDLRDNVVAFSRVYWLKKQDEGWEGPFCTECWDVSGKLVRLQVEDLAKRSFICQNHAGGYRAFTINEWPDPAALPR